MASALEGSITGLVSFSSTNYALNCEWRFELNFRAFGSSPRPRKHQQGITSLAFARLLGPCFKTGLTEAINQQFTHT